MRLARAGAANNEQIALLVQEGTTMTIADQSLIDRRGIRAFSLRPSVS
jgi:hypothetical protein